MSRSVASASTLITRDDGTVTTNADKPLWMRDKKKRRVKRTKTDKSNDDKLYFEVPRKTCEEMVPALLRMKSLPAKDQSHMLDIYKRIMKRARTKKVSKQLQCIVDFDKSESVIPHGVTSKKLYNEIFTQRDFDLYGRPIPKKQLSFVEIEAMARVAEDQGIEFTRVQEKVEDVIKVPNIFDDITADLTNPILTTAKWKVGYEVPYNAPVGMARDPANLFRSQGNEQFFAYDGEWTDGHMQGYGRYKYEDGGECEGKFYKNWQHGEAKATYPLGDSYDGEWIRGKYHGEGTFRTKAGSVYTGSHCYGRRSGYGRIEYPCGLVYEGEWKDGKPHGRGTMTSGSSKFSYEGEFEKGNIRGTGVLVTPEGERVVRLWKESGHGGELTLPGAVRIYVKEKQSLEQEYRARQDQMYARTRGMQMQDYVNKVRAQLHNERTIEKKRRQEERRKAALEQAAKLREARLRALAGDDDDEEDDE